MLFPAVSAILALNHFGFVFKSGTAGSGIIILLLLSIKQSHSQDMFMLMAAFAFSIVGDWFLSNMHGNANMFVTGIAFYFFAHLGYLFYALMNGNITRKFTIFLLLAYLIFFYIELYPAFNNIILMWAALIYLIVSCISLGAAMGLRGTSVTKWTFVFGIFLILFSDTIIAYKEFVGFNKLNFLILPTYYLAHMSIIFSVMKRHLDKTKPGL